MMKLFLFSLLCCVASVCCHPSYWQGCIAGRNANFGHPDRGYGFHTKPVVDRRITFALTQKGKAVKTYCSGATYDLKVTLPEAREFILTTSAGRIKGAAECNGKRLTQAFTRRSEVKTALTVSCTAKGTLVVKVSSANGMSSPFFTNQISLVRGKSCASVARCQRTG